MTSRDPEPLDQDLLGLLEAERKRPAPAVDARARVLARVLATVGPPGGGSGGSPQGGGPPGGGEGLGSGGSVNGAAPSIASGAGGAGGAGGAASAGGAGSAGSAAASLGGSALGKVLIVGLAALALGAAVIAGALSTGDATPERATAVAPAPFLLPTADVPPPASAEVIPPSPDVPPDAPPASLSEAPPSVPHPSVPTPARSMEPGSGAAGRDTVLAAERALLESARTSIAGGQGAAGFEALQRHAREFPRGRLAEEREGLWIRALIASGRMAEARARFTRFRRSYPRSMLLPVFAESLGVDSVTAPEGSPQ